MLVVAHRGVARNHPENSLGAFADAVAAGAHGVELDVRRTADDGLVINHDDTLGDGTVIVEHTAAALIDRLADLDGALDACSPLSLVNIEIKNWPEDKDFDPDLRLVELVLARLEARGEATSARYLISAFHLPTVDRVRALAPDLATGWLLGMVEDGPRLIDRAAEHGHSAVHPHHVFVNRSFVDRAHSVGLQVNTWTCNEPDRIREMEQLGVDTLITDDPEMAIEALSR